MAVGWRRATGLPTPAPRGGPWRLRAAVGSPEYSGCRGTVTAKTEEQDTTDVIHARPRRHAPAGSSSEKPSCICYKGPRDHRLGLLQNDLNTVHATCTPEHPAPALSSPVLGRSLLLSAPVRHTTHSRNSWWPGNAPRFRASHTCTSTLHMISPAKCPSATSGPPSASLLRVLYCTCAWATS